MAASQAPKSAPAVTVRLQLEQSLFQKHQEMEACRETHEKKKRRAEVLNLVKKLMNMQLEEKLKHDILSLPPAQASSAVHAHRESLESVLFSLQDCHRIEPLAIELVKWILARLLSHMCSAVVYDCERLGSSVHDLLFKCAALCDRRELAHTLIAQIGKLVCGATSVSLFDEAACDESPLYRRVIHIDTGDRDEVRARMLYTLLKLLNVLCCRADVVSSLSQTDECVLWMSILQTMQCKALTMEMRTRRESTNLLQRLIVADVGHVTVARLLVPKIFKLEDEIRSSEDSDERVRELRDMLNSLSRAFTSRLVALYDSDGVDSDNGEKRRQRLLDAVSIKDLLEWTRLCAAHALLFPSVIPPRLVSMLCALCRLLCCAEPEDVGEEEAEMLGRVADNVKKVAENLLKSSSAATDDSPNPLADVIHLLIYTDVVRQETSLCSWLVSVCTTSWSRFATRKEEAIRQKRKLIAAIGKDGAGGGQIEEVVARSRQLLPSLMLKEDEVREAVLSCASPACRDGERVLLALMRLIGEMSAGGMHADAAGAWLSMPWLKDANVRMEARRFYASLPALREMNDIVSQCKHIISPGVQEATLSALACLPLKGEWRRMLFERALQSGHAAIVESALTHLPVLVASHKADSHRRLIQIALELLNVRDLANSSTDVSLVLHAINRSLHATSARSEVTSSGVACATCREVSSGVLNPEVAEVPDLLLEVLLAAIQNRHTLNSQIRTEMCSLLFSLLSHLRDAKDKAKEVWLESAVMAGDDDGAVRDEYLEAFAVLVGGECPADILQTAKLTLIKIASPLEETMDEMRDEETAQREETMMLRVAPFLAALASECQTPALASSMLCQLLALCAEYHWNADLETIAKGLVGKLATRLHPHKPQPRKVFERHCRAICGELWTAIQREMAEKRQQEGYNKLLDERQSIERPIHMLAKVFGYGSDEEFIVAAIPLLCPLALLSKDGSVEAECALPLLEHIRDVTGKSRRDLVQEVFPAVCEQTALRTKPSFKFLQNYADMSMVDLYMKKRVMARSYLFGTLAQNEQGVWKILTRCENASECPSLTEMFEYKCEYVGYLMTLTHLLQDDIHYERRLDIVNSYSLVLEKLDEQFVEGIAKNVLDVLRAVCGVGEPVLRLWTAFVVRLGEETLSNMLPQILIEMQPLLVYESSRKLLELIFQQKNVGHSCEERTAIVLLGRDSPGARHVAPFLSAAHADQPAEHVLEVCARMLREECESVGRVVVRRVLETLNGQPLPDTLAAKLVYALLHCIRGCGDAGVRGMAAECFGRIGAVDPGRLALALGEGKNEAESGRREVVFIFDTEKWWVELLTLCHSVFHSIADQQNKSCVGYAIQELLKVLAHSKHETNVMLSLEAECRRDLEPLKKTSLTQNSDTSKLIKERPIVDAVQSYEKWLCQCIISGIKIKNHDVQRMFTALRVVAETEDARFNRRLLPQLVVQLIIEANSQQIREYISEFRRVLLLAVTSSSHSTAWVRTAAHVVFAVVDVLESYINYRIKLKKSTDGEKTRAVEMYKAIMETRMDDGSLLAVRAAEACQCWPRALRWCEQLAIEPTQRGQRGKAGEEARRHYYSLQRIYSHMHDVDGVVGAYKTIERRHQPTPDETVLFLEAVGDFNEALPLYNHTSDRKLKMIKCMLRLNLPELALNTAITAYEQMSDSPSPSSPSSSSSPDSCALRASQMEAAWLLSDWNAVEKISKQVGGVSRCGDLPWGASCATLVSAIRSRDSCRVQEGMAAARRRLTDRLTALTIEDSNTYTQAYGVIAQLHMLYEMDEAREPLRLVGGGVGGGAGGIEKASSRHGGQSREQRPVVGLKAVMDKWQARSECATQCSSVLEPVLRLRRELLRVSPLPRETRDEAVCTLLLQSCRLARQAGHLQIARTFLVEAKQLAVCPQETVMEEARYEFSKKNQSTAIALLDNLLKTKFETTNELFNKLLSKKCVDKEAVLRVPKEERKAYAEVQLLRNEYMTMAGAGRTTELYDSYIALGQLNVSSEDLYYRVACFVDRMFTQESEGTQDNSKFRLQLLTTYSSVLRHGRSHLFHAMPRMLTIWLDTSEKKTRAMLDRKKEGGSAASHRLSLEDEKDTAVILQMNDAMADTLRAVDPYCFYTAFPQLISRISHPNEDVFKLLKNMVAQLLVQFPHQCLWQSIAVYRSTEPNNTLVNTREKQQRCATIYEVACRKNKELASLIDQYDYLSYHFIKIAEDKNLNTGRCKLPQASPILSKLSFSSGTIDTSVLMPSSSPRPLFGRHSSRPGQLRCAQMQVVVPFMQCMQAESAGGAGGGGGGDARTQTRVRSDCLSQLMVDESPVVQSGHIDNVFIAAMELEVLVLSSMQRPKRVGVRGSDGRVYQLLLKCGDEMRKDARFMDINRMMNTMMRQNAEARRRQLAIKAFTVVPLQNKGGLMEWVPEVEPYRAVLGPLLEEGRHKTNGATDEKIGTSKWNAKWSDEEKIAQFRTLFTDKYPTVMQEWFRRQFTDPCSWHAARVNFARTAAVMSMVGFVVGLGDRHAENMLLDMNSGGVVHVDFNLLFNQGEFLPVCEVVPFRLTRNMVAGMGASGVEGAFRVSAEAAMRVMRANADTLLTVMETLVHDPLLEFSTVSKSQQGRNRTGVLTCPEDVRANAAEKVDMIRKRLHGHIVSPKIYKGTFESAMGLEGQVAKLIELAMDEGNICKMFIGWSPYL